MNKSELAKRYILLTIGLFFSALGVAFTKHAELGVSPISSVSNVMSCKFPALSLGTWLILWNCLLIAGQIVLLRRKFNPIQLLQIPLSFFFGWFTDLGMLIVSPIPKNSYPVCLMLVFIGIVLLSFGIALTVIANVIMNSGEAFVKAIADTTHKEFGHIKIGFDVACVVLAVVLSLLFFDFTVVGTREGTVLTALLTGIVVKFFTGKLRAPLITMLSEKKAA